MITLINEVVIFHVLIGLLVIQNLCPFSCDDSSFLGGHIYKFLCISMDGFKFSHEHLF
jgi:hypothetical protein